MAQQSSPVAVIVAKPRSPTVRRIVLRPPLAGARPSGGAPAVSSKPGLGRTARRLPRKVVQKSSEKAKTPSESPISKAIKYARNQREALQRFLGTPKW